MSREETNRLFDIAIRAAIEAGDKILEVYESDDLSIEIKEDDSPVTKADKLSSKVIVSRLAQTSIPVLSEEEKEAPYEVRKNWKRLWIVDPLDGTKEFIKHNGEFAVNIALIEDKKPLLGVIYIPVSNEIFWGAKNYGAYSSSKEKYATEGINSNHIKLPFHKNKNEFVVTGSRSHGSEETQDFFEKLKETHPNSIFKKVGSSVKFCRLAEGTVDLYPRFQYCMEWDTAAGHAILQGAGKNILKTDGGEVLYNKENLLSPFFIAQ